MRLKALWWDEDTLPQVRPQTSVWWDNFRKEIKFRGPEERAERLSEWGAVWVDGFTGSVDFCRCLDFENEHDATVFLLRWS